MYVLLFENLIKFREILIFSRGGDFICKLVNFFVYCNHLTAFEKKLVVCFFSAVSSDFWAAFFSFVFVQTVACTCTSLAYFFSSILCWLKTEVWI